MSANEQARQCTSALDQLNDAMMAGRIRPDKLAKHLQAGMRLAGEPDESLADVFASAGKGKPARKKAAAKPVKKKAAAKSAKKAVKKKKAAKKKGK